MRLLKNELNKMIDKESEFEKGIRAAEGTLKHSGMYLTDRERELLRKHAYGEISTEEYISIIVKEAKEENI